jgi:hypothetical protein
VTENNSSIREVAGVGPDGLTAAMLVSDEPLLLKGMVADWPLVQAGKESAAAADAYIRSYYQNATVGAFIVPPEANGRVFYNDDLSGFNFQRIKLKLDEVLDLIARHQSDENPPCIYVGSTTVDVCLPGLRAENDIDLGSRDPFISIWMGNQSRIAAHYDLPDNVACCAVGHRRFTLFPPEQLANLYVGPLEFTPAGQAISMVDFDNPDFERFPRFRAALEAAIVVDMEPGDALFIPGMWWHHVEALDNFNVLVNYWWRRSPGFMDTPANVLEHAILSIRDLPVEQRKAWQDMFEFYVFNFSEKSVEHIPVERRGMLSPTNEFTARQIRARLLRKLNR